MGAAGRACTWERQLPSTPNCTVEYVARGIRWFAGKLRVRAHTLVEPAGTGGTRGRYGANARFTLAKRAMARRLHLQGCACGHGRGAWLALPAAIHHSVIESSHCPARIGRKLFGHAVLAATARSRRMRVAGLTCSLVWQTIRHNERSLTGRAAAHQDSA